jgi:hypothetical protein
MIVNLASVETDLVRLMSGWPFLRRAKIIGQSEPQRNCRRMDSAPLLFHKDQFLERLSAAAWGNLSDATLRQNHSQNEVILMVT